MHKLLPCVAAMIALGASGAVAQSAQPVNPPTAATGSPADTTAGGGLKVGLSVKDSTGATIGQLAELNRDAAGKQMATIRMGDATVSVEADRLTVRGGAATINATQAELRALAKKPRA